MASKSMRLITEPGLALVATLGLLVSTGSLALAQDGKDKKAKEPEAKLMDQAKARMPVRAGFTRPGYPADELTKEGKIKPIAFQSGARKIIGGTVYFSVFERTGAMLADGDLWGTGLANLHEMFSEGYSFQGSFSPHLDTRGRYLYLYQIVNDRGLDRSDRAVVPAADDRKELNTSDIAGFALRLSVSPQDITSWGFFRNSAFAVQVPRRTAGGEIIPAVDGADAKITLAVSSYQPVLGELSVKRYAPQSPAFPLPVTMASTWSVGAATLNLKMVEDHKKLIKMQTDGIKLVGYEKNKLGAATAARTPDFVQIIYAQGDEHMAIGQTGEDFASVVFRADFRTPLKPGEHSVIFGFTTDLPPQDEPLRVEEHLALAGGVAPAAGAGHGTGAGAGIAAAAGVAPGPVPAPPAGGALGSLGGVGGAFGGAGGGGGFGGGFPFAAGGIGFARAPVSGGGVAGASGHGNESQGGQQSQTPNINFNATLTNQQQQQQKQQQQQTQNNDNGHGHHHHGNVVPEPGSIILALLGAPGLVWLWRRKNLTAA